MAPENQGRIKELVEQYGEENLVVVLGMADTGALEVAAETLSQGDPSFAGPLAGVSLGLPLFHILEPSVLEIVPEDIRRQHLEMLTMVVDQEELVRLLGKFRRL